MNEIISLRILKLVADGMDVAKAFDAVLGDGTYQKMANELHAELNS